MELLAPAGNMEQALKSIEFGCDAIYGGLKNWNARSRADNFTLEEYRQILEICHKRGVKFYLTLNTLFRDEELHAIRTLFSAEDFQIPDAVLVADIGLMRMFYEEFPNVVVHASTQFGAYSVDDVAFLERCHVKRVVLARELTLSEIRNLRKKTGMELEVFTYGSQCVCFSGQCLWGGLINESSGNRGRCTGMCRDLYCKDERMGQFMYPQDIDAIELVELLQSIGINSIKIEGRIRDLNETANAVKRYRNAIDKTLTNGRKSEQRYSGYLSDVLPVKHMLNVMNPRTCFPSEQSANYGEHDILYIDQPMPRICNGKQLAHQQCRYVTTAFTDKFVLNEVSISINIVFQNRFLDKVIIIDTFGKRSVINIYCRNLASITVTNLFQYMKRHVNIKIYEFVANVPENEIVNIDWEELEVVIQKIHVLCKHQECKRKALDCENQIPFEYTMIQTDDVNELKQFQKAGIRNYIFEIKSKHSLLMAMQEEKQNVSIIYKLPILDFTQVLEELMPLLKGRRILLSRASQLLLIDKYDFGSVYADYTLNIWNSNAVELLKEYGVVSFTAHPELSTEYVMMLSKKNVLPFSVIAAGKIPLGFTRACFGELELCDKNCKHSVFYLKNIAKGYDIQIRCDNDFGYRSIVGTDLDVLCADVHGAEFRYMISGMNPCEKNYIINGNFKDACSMNYIYGRNVK